MTNNDTPLPTDAEVREVYATIQDQENGEEWAATHLEVEFDAWLAAHDARVKAEAWDEGWGHAVKVYRASGTGPRIRNPYKP